MEKHNYEKPYYTIYPSVYCSGEIWVNDVLVGDWHGKKTEDSIGYGGATPINQVLLESGKYKVIGKMFPRYGEKTLTEKEYMSIEFYLADVSPGRWKETDHQFQPMIESPWGGLSEGINYPYFEIGTEIEVKLPFVLDGWQHSVNLKELYKDRENELKKEVLAFYRQIHALLEEHNAAKFMEISQEKEKLQAQAFYFDQERRKGLLNGASELFGKNMKVLPIKEEEIKLTFMGYGKLVTLTRLDGSSPLQFNSNSQEEGNTELEIKLHMRTKEKGLSII